MGGIQFGGFFIAPTANQMIQRRANGVRPLARVSQPGSLAQQFQGSLVQRCAIPFRQAADAISQLVVKTPDRQLIHVANPR